jgi:sirohydrochlorin cobaltochelatase
MLKRLLVSWIVAIWILCSGAMALAGAHHGMEHEGASEKGPAILLVTFGTSIPSAQAAFDNIEEAVKAEFPGVPVKWAYTSYIIREKLAKSGRELDSPEVALAKLMDEGYSRVAVQSLHIMPGAEFHDLRISAGAFKGMTDGFKQLLVGYPALSTSEDLSKAVDAIFSIIPKERKPDEAVVLMGHGTHHPSNTVYEAMMYRLQRRDPNVYMGTVEGTPSLKDVKGMLLSKGVKKAYLLPFMSVAGDHTVNDLAGDEDDSWKRVLTGAGIQCVPVIKGLAEYDAFVDIWLDHLKVIMAHIK